MRKSNARFNTLQSAMANASTTQVTNWKGVYVSPNCIMRETKGTQVHYCLRHVTKMAGYEAECMVRGVDVEKIVTL